MAHVFEPAASGRAKCRGCGQALPKGEVRFGEKLANPFAEGEMTHWFHPLCAAYKRPDAIVAALENDPGAPDRDALERVARATLAFARLARIDGAEPRIDGRRMGIQLLPDGVNFFRESFDRIDHPSAFRGVYHRPAIVHG